MRIKRSNKNTDHGDGGGQPKKQKNDSRILALETQNKDLNDKITQILATLSAQGQSAPDPQNTNKSNRTNPNLVRIHRHPTQNQSGLLDPSESLAGREMISGDHLPSGKGTI